MSNSLQLINKCSNVIDYQWEIVIFAKSKESIWWKQRKQEKKSSPNFRLQRRRKRNVLSNWKSRWKRNTRNVQARRLKTFCTIMQSLSLEHINEKSSYQVEPTDKDGFYQFFTDGGVHYFIGFMEDDVLFVKNSYQLIIANLNNHKSPVIAKYVIPLFPSLTNSSIATILHCFISVKQVMTNNVCVVAYLNIGSRLTTVKPFSQWCHLLLWMQMALWTSQQSFFVMTIRICLKSSRNLQNRFSCLVKSPNRADD